MSEQDKNKNLISINTLCSSIEFSGENCIHFLNNLLISDLLTFEKDKFYYSAICNPKGRIISSLWISLKSDDRVTLICPTNMSQDLIHFFNMRKFRLKININLVNRRIIMDSDDNVSCYSTDEPLIVQEANRNEFYSRLFNVNFPWINKDNTEIFIPQHVNLDQHDNVMSFTKGCYPGQEIIARMKFLGKINKRMKVIDKRTEELLLTEFDSRNQVSPIIKTANGFSVQVIEKLVDLED